MPMATVLGQLCTGHGSFPPRPSTSGSDKVLIAGVPVVRVGDSYAVHSSSSGSHPGVAQTGSPKVLVAGVQRMRVGDPINCGSRVQQGTPKVLIG